MAWNVSGRRVVNNVQTTFDETRETYAACVVIMDEQAAIAQVPAALGTLDTFDCMINPVT